MATYAQVLKSETGGRRQWWYISGGVPALVQDAYELALAHVYSINVEIEKRVFLASEVTLEELEYELTRDMFAARQVVVLHEAEKFPRWDELSKLLRSTGSDRFFIAVSYAEPPDTKQPWTRLFVGSQKARFVVCDEMGPMEKSTWVQSRVNLTREAEDLLIQRAWGDYGWLLNQMRKLEYVGVDTITRKHVESLCPPTGAPDFVASLARGGRHKRAALVSLQRGGVDEGTLSGLSHMLTMLVRLDVEKKKRTGFSTRQLVDRTGLTQKQISVYRADASYYDLQVATRCFSSLVRLYEGLRRGDRLSYLALITRW